jgi:hypothetical protein
MATDVLSKSAQEIRKRLAQLEPMVAEHERLKEALAALERGVGADGSALGGKGSRARRTRPSRTTKRRVVTGVGRRESTVAEAPTVGPPRHARRPVRRPG